MNPSRPPSLPAGTPVSSAETCRWLGAAMVLVGACLPALNNSTDLPSWDADPVVAFSPMNGLGPAGFMAVAALLLLGSSLVFLGAALARESVSRVALGAAACFGVAVAWHGWWSPVRTVADQYVGALWAAGVWGAIALGHACRDERVRAGAAACLLGLVVALCLKGVVQLGVEHPEMVEHFRRNRPAMLAAQGLVPDSPMARMYERRIEVNVKKGSLPSLAVGASITVDGESLAVLETFDIHDGAMTRIVCEV